MNKSQQDFKHSVKQIYRAMQLMFGVVGLVTCFLVYGMIDPTYSIFGQNDESMDYAMVDEDDNWDKIENGIHLRTGLIDGVGLMETVNNCTNCHSAKLVTQNRMDAARWAATIDWMQQTQNLWDLGGNEEIIINYLVTNYPVKKKGRRMTLENIQWYDLEN